MANPEYVELIRKGVSEWNRWRAENENLYYSRGIRDWSTVRPDLSRADLSELDLGRANLGGAGLHGADLHGTNLLWANLCGADLHGANLSGASLGSANLSQTNLSGADLSGANLGYTDLGYANLSRANLSDADLTQAALINTNLEGATLTRARVYGVSVWDVKLQNAIQTSLVITPYVFSLNSPNYQPEITVDDLEVAQFIYLLLHNSKIRNVIDTITSKAVLILGCFTPERKTVLEALREELRRRNYLPILFDFGKPAHRDLTETISTLAHMARFVIADITDARSIPQELQMIVPNLPSVPVQPLLLASQQEFGMFEHFRNYPWVLEPVLYEDQEQLLAAIADKVIGPAEMKAKAISAR